MNFNNSILESWESKSLDDVCAKITSGGTPSRKNKEFYTNGNNFWVKTKELNNWYLESTEEMITDDAIRNSSAKILPKNTILLAMYGATVGELGILKHEMTCNQACCALIIDSEKADYKFVFYLLRCFKERIKGLATGAAQQNLSAAFIKEFVFQFPSIDKQRKIAKILGDLDDKIQLNTQTNQTLEAIAQAIFKSWFVDFDPVHAKANALADGASDEQATLSAMSVISGKSADELITMNRQNPEHYQQLWEIANAFPSGFDGEVPLGWESVALGAISSIVSKGTTPRKSDIEKALSDENVIFIKVKDLNSSSIVLNSDFEKIPSDISHGVLKRSILQTDDILFSIAGTIGRVAIVPKFMNKSNANQAISFIRLKDLRLKELVYLFLLNNETQENINSKIVQGVQANVSLTTLRNLEFILPKSIDSYDILLPYFKNLIDEIEILKLENINLSKIRDELLPKLLSGELEI